MERKSLTKLVTLFLLLTLALTGCFTQKNDATSVANDSNAKRAFSSALATLNVRGTFNNWTSTPMVLVANNSWKVTVTFAGTTSTERFKFDVRGDWGQNYGDNTTRDGIADQNGADIPVVGGKTYDITFNDITRAYTVVEAAAKKTITFRANLDGMGANYGMQGVVFNVYKITDLNKIVLSGIFSGSIKDGGSVDVPGFESGITYKAVVAQDANILYGPGSEKRYVTGEAIFTTATPGAVQLSVSINVTSEDAKRNIRVNTQFINGSGATNDLVGRVAKLYKQPENTLATYQSIGITSASTTGTYFTKLDAGTTYRIVIDEIVTTATDKRKVTAAALFTTNFANVDQPSVNLTVNSTQISNRDITISMSIASTVRPSTGILTLEGLKMDLYKSAPGTISGRGALVSTAAIRMADRMATLAAADFYGLDASTEYIVVLNSYIKDYINEEFKITANGSFTTTAENVVQTKKDIGVWFDNTLANVYIYTSIPGLTMGQSSSGYDHLLNGMIGKLYKNGTYLKDVINTPEEYQMPCFHIPSLGVGAYEIKFDSTDAKTGFRYTGNSKFDITADIIVNTPLFDGSMVVTETKKSFVSSVPSAYFRGTPNNWGAKLMDLVADETWTTTVVSGATASERFKIDIKGDWSENYGLNGVKGGSDIPLKANTTYVITFKSDTKAITAVEQSAKVTQYVVAQVVESGFTISNPDKNSFARGCTVNVYDATNTKVATGTLVGSQVNFPNLDNGKTYTAKINETKTLTDPAYPTGAFEFTANQTFVASGTANLTLTVNVKQVILKDSTATFEAGVTYMNYTTANSATNLLKDVMYYVTRNGTIEVTGKFDVNGKATVTGLERGKIYVFTIVPQIVTVTDAALPANSRVEVQQFSDTIFTASSTGGVTGPYKSNLNATYLPSDVTAYFAAKVNPLNIPSTPGIDAIANNVKVDLYKGTQYIASSTFGGSTMGTTFTNLERGAQYKIVVPEQTVSNYSAEYAGKYAITVYSDFPFGTPKDSNATPTLPISINATKIIECDYYFHGGVANANVPPDVITGLTVKLYKDGATTEMATTTIGSPTQESGISFRGLKPGTYKAVVDEVRYNSSYFFTVGDTKYKGEVTFTIDAEGKPTQVPAPSLQVLLTAIKYQASIYLKVPYLSNIDLKDSTIAVTNPSGVVKNYVLGSKDKYDQFCAELTDLTSAGTYRVVLNKTITNAIVSADFTFTLTAEKPSTSPVTVVTVTNIEKKKNFANLYERGTNNGWTTTAMTLTADNTWSLTITTKSSTSERFKFDVKGDWSQNYGDTNKDGVGDLGGSDIVLAANSTYDITFNDSTLKYTVTKK